MTWLGFASGQRDGWSGGGLAFARRGGGTPVVQAEAVLRRLGVGAAGVGFFSGGQAVRFQQRFVDQILSVVDVSVMLQRQVPAVPLL